MGVTVDRYEGMFAGRKIELVRNKWSMTLNLLIDGVVVASTYQLVPLNLTIDAEFELDGVKHVVAFRTRDTIEIDGRPLSLTKMM